ncbi:hypothetical protein [Promineifilum sp.]|uniref:hypothetical protein n=1 Tax=Promineifilum sp. TaxID=2664178 RepID=UPI0035B29042
MEPNDITPQWERSLEQLARRFDYPATPDVAAVVLNRIADSGRRATDDRRQAAGRRPLAAGRGRLVWTLLALALIMTGLLAVPQTRAAILSLVTRIGAITIFTDETAPTALPSTALPPTPQPSPPPAAAPAGQLPLIPSTATPVATLAASPSPPVAHSLELFQLGEPVTLDEARQSAPFAPVEPAALGAPDEVYIHRNVDLPALTLVWRKADDALLSLTQIGVPEFASKLIHDEGVTFTFVGEWPAVWLEGPHMLQLLGNWQANSLLIDSNVLIWADGEITYRLEGAFDLAEARRIAESIRDSSTD